MFFRPIHLVLTLILLTFSTLAAAKVADSQPNILFIITDQQHANMLSVAGNPYLKTPALDKLAKNGIRFTNAYVTNPVCTQS